MRTRPILSPISLSVFAFVIYLAPTSGEAQEFAPPQSCDRLAAHPDDRYRFAAGVSDSLLATKKAVAACKEAVEKFPKVTRFQFQLGRALFLAGRNGEAVTSLKQAYLSSYAPAAAYLGVMLETTGKAKDKKLGHKLLLQAQNGGFEVAKSMHLTSAKASVSGTGSGKAAGGANSSEPAVVQQAKAKYLQAASKIKPPSFDSSGFAKSGILQRLFEGTANSGDRRDINQLHYYKFLNEILSSKGFGIVRPECLQLYNSGLSVQLASAAISAAGFDGSANDVSRRGWQMLAQTMRNIQRGGVGAIVAGAAQRASYIEGGKKDGVLLVQRYGCGSRTTKLIYGNLQRLFSSSSLIKSPEIERRKQLLYLQGQTTSQCKIQYEQSNFCSCIVGQLRRANLNIIAWREMSMNFNVAANVLLVIKSPREKIRKCYDR